MILKKIWFNDGTTLENVEMFRDECTGFLRISQPDGKPIYYNPNMVSRMDSDEVVLTQLQRLQMMHRAQNSKNA